MSSARMHPALQMSTAVPYLVAPNSSSGGRYQSVITLLVNSCELPRLMDDGCRVGGEFQERRKANERLEKEKMKKRGDRHRLLVLTVGEKNAGI